MANAMHQQGALVGLENIDALRGQKLEPVTAPLIGFCGPTHGFNYPPVLVNFLLRFPRGKQQKVFVCNTRAGLKAGKLFVPGLSGIALLLAALILLMKGYRLAGMRSFDMPSNWISIHPGVKEKVARSIMLRCRSKAQIFALDMLNGNKNLRALYDLAQDLLIAPISLGYYLVGRFIFAKSFYADQHCTICGLCIKNCPVKAIHLVDQRPYWTIHCESCMRCMNTCPERAIQTAHGLVIGVLYVVMAFGMHWVWLSLLNLNNLKLDRLIEQGLLRFTVESIVALGFLVLAYRLMHFLLKFSIFESLVRYTSLTSYRCWRRFKGMKFRFAPTTMDQQEA